MARVLNSRTVVADLPSSVDDGAAQQIRNLLCRTGYVLIQPISPLSVVARAHAATAEFFGLAAEDKERFVPPPGHFLGYRGIATERGSTDEPHRPADLKERYALGRAPAEHPRNDTADNADDLVRRMDEVLAEYAATMDGLTASILRILCPALEIPADFFDAPMAGGLAFVVALNYPRQSGGLTPVTDQLRAGPHRDRSCLTILTGHPDQPTTGLQFHTDRRWTEMVVPAGALLVNIGSMLEDWTAGRLSAPLHRVRNPTGNGADNRTRQTLAYFANPRSEIVLDPIRSGDRPAHRGQTVSEYLASMFALHTS
ncbi:isopenicillin N synthase family oxygenase [Nocardia sp. 2]|uniref:Isopenicillin N synthase family oxygenase n=1 Tax=Nocardia acididurans TaxID=2802282 RepID=A0ABS1MKE0_9NOCA|nr:isopenicillin N synthase family oxygenase [Nocardia acididurans]MBL1079718.1 isopenicillin N synthase family oxygenase [Nocardia acididurans]